LGLLQEAIIHGKWYRIASMGGVRLAAEKSGSSAVGRLRADTLMAPGRGEIGNKLVKMANPLI
jgi:hypothetical protein